MPTVVIINGFPGSGKDQFVEFCRDVHPQVTNYHTSDQAKFALSQLGWDGSKTPEARKLLADLVEFSYTYDEPLKQAKRLFDSLPHNAVLFIHCREYENILKFQEAFRTRCYTVFINRDSCNNDIYSNESDAMAGAFQNTYKYTIHNNGTLYDLRKAAAQLMLLLTGRGVSI